MKIRSQDRDYVMSKGWNKGYLKQRGVGYNQPYVHTNKILYTDDGITKTKYVTRDTFDILDDGLCKCQKCYTYMIPVVEDGKLVFYNLDSGEKHYKYVKRQNSLNNRYKTRKGIEWICQI